MEKLLDQLLKNNYTKRELINQLRLITTDIKAENACPSKGKLSPSEPNLITPDIIEKLPLITITLVVSLPKEELQRLGQWFRQNVDPQILLEIREDPKIIGGCQIIWRGFEGDFSLRKKFQKTQNVVAAALRAASSRAPQSGAATGPESK